MRPGQKNKRPLTQPWPRLETGCLPQTPGFLCRLRPFFWLLLAAGLTFGCNLLAGPQQPAIPSPPPFSTPVLIGGVPPETAVDPVSEITLSADPEIAALAEAVSTQQLTAYVRTLAAFGTRSTFSVVDQPAAGVGAARTWIYEELVRVGSGRLQVELDDFDLNHQGVSYPQQNVVATLPGRSGQSGAIVLMAHYDSRTIDPNNGSGVAPGANDNASGVALLLELARLLSARSWERTIIFVAFAAEEQGTHGSRHFVADRLLAGWQVAAALNNDIVGGRPGIPQTVRVFTPGPDTSTPRQLARYVRFIGRLYVPTLPADLQDAVDRPERFSDHIRFLDAGIPALRLTESVEDISSQHNAFDTPEKIDYDYLRRVAQLNLAAIASMAGAPPPPETLTVAAMAAPGAFLLTWVPDPQAVAYAISFRPVGSDAYAPFRFVTASQAGNVALTGFDPAVAYAVSVAAVGVNGRLGLFSPEFVVSAPGS
ncbi:MAG: M20/M25/M40 family metallo-hydrolase [Anaerolineales bacterium]|nr:M20/M25/M40 family metallo-hydrolase [Anaerolineales bacterium]